MTRLALRILLRRALVAVPVMLIVSIMIFVVLRMLPVDPLAMSVPPNATLEDIAAMRHAMGLDRPVHEQYAIWLGDVVGGDFGRSIHFREAVVSLIAKALPATVELVALAIVIASVLGLAGGLLLFHLRGTRTEPVADIASTAMMSIPDFLWAIFLILSFGVAWNLLPFTGRMDPEFARPVHTGFLLLDTVIEGRADMVASAFRHMLLPAFSLALGFSPPIMRVLRSSLLDVYHEDYITQARRRGLGEVRVLVGHALRNAVLPTLTLMGVQFGFLFGGTLLVEVIYSYPGMGSLMVEAVRNADLPIIQAVVLMYCLVIVAINATVDVAYLILNPRMRPA